MIVVPIASIGFTFILHRCDDDLPRLNAEMKYMRQSDKIEDEHSISPVYIKPPDLRGKQADRQNAVRKLAENTNNKWKRN